VLAALAARETEPARGIEAFAACGVRWLVEQVLKPEATEPDPEPMRRGSLAHAVLERALELLGERTGTARLAPERLDAALEALRDALAERARTGGHGARHRVVLHGLAADLDRYVRREAECGAHFEPDLREWRFGGPDDPHGPLPLGEGAGAVVGRVDRIDLGPGGEAMVLDYKGRAVTAGARWADQGQLQVALYLLAVRDLLGHTPVAGLYQPLAGKKLEPRGLVREGVPGRYVRTDVVDDAAFEETLEEVRAVAAGVVADLRAGRLRPCPERCTSRGCRYPGICRAGEGGRDTPSVGAP
jgi:RecB family exonuclease